MSLIATPNIEALKYSYVLKKLYPNYDKFIFVILEVRQYLSPLGSLMQLVVKN